MYSAIISIEIEDEHAFPIAFSALEMRLRYSRVHKLLAKTVGTATQSLNLFGEKSTYNGTCLSA